MNGNYQERLNRLKQPRAEPPAALPADEVLEAEIAEEQESSPSYSMARASRLPEISLRLRLLDGRRRAIAYALLQDVLFDPDTGITLEFAHCKVQLAGRNLLPLFDRLADHAVRFIQELDELASERLEESATAVTRIRVESL